MDPNYVIECQFVSAGYNLKQWDLVKSKSSKSVQMNEYDVYKSTDTEFLIPVESSIRQPFTSVVFDSNGNNVASLIANNQELYFSTMKEGMSFRKISLKNPHCMTYIGLDSNFLAVGCVDSLCIVDTKVLKVVDIFPIPKSDDKSDKITSMDSSFSSSLANLIVIGTERGRIFMFLCFHEKKISKQIFSTDVPITIIRFSPHLFHIVATSHSNGDVNIWDMEKKILIHSLFSVESPICVCIDFSPFRDDLLGVGNKDGLICIFDVKKLVKVGQICIPNSMVTGLIFLKNGIDIIVGDDKGQIHIYNLRTLQQCRSYRLHSSTLQVLALKIGKFSNLFGENEKLKKPKKNISKKNEGILDVPNLPQNRESNLDLSVQNHKKLYSEFRDDSLATNGANLEQHNNSNDVISPLRTIHFPNNELHMNSAKLFNPVAYCETPRHLDNSLRITSNLKRDDDMRTSPQMILSSATCLLSSSSYDNCHIEDIGSRMENCKKVPARSEEKSNHKTEAKSSDYSAKCEDFKFSHQNDDILSPAIVLRENSIERNYINSILDSHTNDIKDFICQQMITLMSELTRNVTNLQLQIVSLDSKMEAIQYQVDEIKKNISKNTQFLNY